MAVAMRIDIERLGHVADALADETRRLILVELLDGARYPAELAEALGVGRTNVSNHLACLRGCGLVTATPEGRRMRYDVVDPDLGEALAALSAVALRPTDGCEHRP